MGKPRKGYWHQYYIEHKEHYAEYNKERRKYDKVKSRIYQRMYMKEYNKRPENREKHRAYNNRRRNEIKKKIGSICSICGNDKHITFHEVHGKIHPTNNKYYREHLEDFAPLCIHCHKILHNFHKEIGKFLPLLNKLNS